MLYPVRHESVCRIASPLPQLWRMRWQYFQLPYQPPNINSEKIYPDRVLADELYRFRWIAAQ
ncbi:hypothetical protein [Aerosakkonema sp. BLCC-F183]|uniref:hypothetical protein n=1 Tax=Aerosakkonema sp. BLCC-F183 TaxID=3342834 RepID=UPI0035BC1C1F